MVFHVYRAVFSGLLYNTGPDSLEFDVSSLPPGNSSLTMTVVNECGQRNSVTFIVEIREQRDNALVRAARHLVHLLPYLVHGTQLS